MACSMDFQSPDRSLSDYYCQLCQSHMNSEQMWESHIAGKRHQKNLKKGPSEESSKVKSYVVENGIPDIQEELNAIRGNIPVVGLSFMSESRKADSRISPSYSCYLCNAQLVRSMVIQHILEPKHRMFYLRAVNKPVYDNMMGLKLNKQNLDPLILEHSMEMELQYGRGMMEVKVDKPVEPVSFGRQWTRHDKNWGGCSRDEEDEFMLSEDKGIREIDLFSNHLSLDMELKLLNYAVIERNLRSLRDDVPEDREKLEKFMNLSKRAISNYNIRKLPKKEQQDIMDRMAGEGRPTEQTLRRK